MNIYQKLSEIQSELKAPKNQYNSFGGYHYRNCEDIFEAIKPICKKHQAVLFISDDVEFIDSRFYIKATATLFDLENENQNIKVSAFAREEQTKKGMDSSQITGACSSYARKYALNGLFNIDDTKDSDFLNKGETKTTQPIKKVDELTSAKNMLTTQGKKYGDLSNDQLQFIIDNGKSDISKKYAKLVLGKRGKEADRLPWEEK